MKQLFIYINKAQAALEQLNDAQAGLLFRRLVAYVAGNDNPTGDPLVDAIFCLFKVEIDEGYEHYNGIIEKRRAAGRKHKGNQYTSENGTNGTLVPNLEQNGTNGTNGSKNKTKTKNKTTSIVMDEKEIRGSSAPPAPPAPQVDEFLRLDINDSVSKMLSSLSYSEQICMKYHINFDELRLYANAFIRDCRVRGNDKHQNERELKSHFDSWLTIRKEIERKEEKNGNSDKSNIERMFGVAISGKDIFGGN